MVEENLDEFVRKAEQIYSDQLRVDLEREHIGDFVAIEPESGDYFLGKTLSQAAQAARSVYPDRLTNAMRIGQNAAIHSVDFTSPVPQG